MAGSGLPVSATLRDLIDWGAHQFDAAQLHFGHGTDNAADEALLLALFAINLDYSIPESRLDAVLTADERRAIEELFQSRIAERVPASYLINRAWFCGLEFYVDSRVLIPRSPIAELIEQQFAPWLVADRVKNILEIGTGSGCIAIACSQFFPDAQIDAVDISPAALEVSAINVAKHTCQAQVRLIESDLFSALPPIRYDLIVANPPYVDAADLAAMPQEFHHEPSLGLAAGAAGLDLVLPILAQASDYLAVDGIMVIEVGNSAAALADEFPQVPFIWLEFERGGEGVFLLTGDQVQEYSQDFRLVNSVEVGQ